jgi:ferredoxin-NADP reductase
MTVVRVVHETAEATSLVLQDQTGRQVEFKPGQFFSVAVAMPEGELRRTYSATSAPGEFDGGVRITVKRVPGGKVSQYLNEQVREGSSLALMGPLGRFYPATAQGPRRLVLIAGGSGITPMLAIARTLLPREPQTRLRLIYGNRSEADIIFRQELAALEEAWPGRFEVRLVLSAPLEGWTGPVGVLNRELLSGLLGQPEGRSL